MTHLLELPNELLLQIFLRAGEVGQRRFSKTCRRLFHLIREQRNWKRYNVRKGIYSVEVCAYARDVYFVCFNSIYGDVHYIVHPLHGHVTPHMLKALQQFTSRVSNVLITPIRSSDVRGTTLSLLKGAAQYYIMQEYTYECSAELFDTQIARLIGKSEVYHKATFSIFPDELTKRLEEIYQEILLVFLECNRTRRNDNGTHYVIISEYGDDEHDDMDRISAEVNRWRNGMMNRLDSVCEENQIAHHFIKDQKRMADIYRDFFLRRHRDGRVEGRYGVAASSRAHQRVLNRRVEQFETDSDEWDEDSFEYPRVPRQSH